MGEMSSARLIVGDVFDVLATLPDDSVDLVLTSPPFLNLRSYLPDDHPTKSKEIGAEPTPAAYLDRLFDVVEACDRVLAPHGSLVFEIGDTYSGSGGAGGDYNPGGLRDGQNRFVGSGRAANRPEGGSYGNRPGPRRERVSADDEGWPLPKSICFIPELFGASLAYGRHLLRPERTLDRWRIRNLVVWCKPNPTVGNVADKFRPATSFLTVACKSRTRWFDLDAVRVPSDYERPNLAGKGSRTAETLVPGQKANRSDHTVNPAGGPPLDWWEIPTEPYPEAHYATWPRDLLIRPVLSMCPERVCRVCGEPSRRIVERQSVGKGFRRSREDRLGQPKSTESPDVAVRTTIGWTDCGHDDWRPGVVLDPFAGSGTTLAVATGHGRDAVGIDLDAENAELVRGRVGMFVSIEYLSDLASEPVS